jgi:propionate catabolism operon transcriptional regulator
MSGRRRKYRFALVSHAIEVVNLVRQHSDPATEALYTTIVALEDAVATAEALIRDGYDVILGHGGTGGMIARSIGQPVVNIPITMLDVITALLEARQQGRKIAVTSFAAGREGFDTVRDVLGMDVQQIVFNNQAELERGVEKAIQCGVDTIVGGGVSRKIAARLQAEAVIIMPGGQTVKEALAQARALAGVRRREIEHHERLRTIFEIMDDGMLCVDASCNLKIFNATAETLLGKALGPHLGRSVTEVADTLGLQEVLATGTKRSDAIIRIQNREVVTTCLPILVDGRVNGAVGLLKEGRAIQNIDRKLRERIHRQGFVAHYTMADIVAVSSPMQNLITRAAEFARTEAAILVSGETGTGKEVLTHALHNASRRRQAPFVAINCAALPENLLESELFGYEEGAFTGAKKGGKIGLFELANHGTIFLDEIGDISSSLQVRLLRVLENKEVMRVGGDRIVPVDVRVISSTHKDLQVEVRAGNFRRDLYYRLAVLRLNLPPLRERMQDIPQLLAPLLKRYRKPASCLTPAMRERIQSYPWAGNIRELNALMESYLILLGPRPIDERLFDELCEEYAGTDRPRDRSQPKEHRKRTAAAAPGNERPVEPRSLTAHLEDHKRHIIRRTLRECGHNKTLTARRLGISTNTLWRALKKANVRAPDQ